MQYVDFIVSKTRVHGAAITLKKMTPGMLDKWIPLYGPRFTLPTFLDLQKHQSKPEYHLSILYLKVVNVIHPFYFLQLNDYCPHCESFEISWEGWTTSRHRDVHALRAEETTLGVQLHCGGCTARKLAGEEILFSFATTNLVFWDQYPHWKIPRQFRNIYL